MYNKILEFIQSIYGQKDAIPLHVPVFNGNEKEYLCNCIDTTFVSSVGEYVNKFEEEIAKYTGISYAIATVNGTSALHIALKLAGVEKDMEVITQPLTFIATCNAISYLDAKPVFVDVDKYTFGLSPEKLESFLINNTFIDKDGNCVNKHTQRIIKACVPMHTFGFPCNIDEIFEICNKNNIKLVEDVAESLGSYYKEKHTGILSEICAMSFNGNKIITTGGGGMILTNNEELAKKAKHITTTAKLPHKYEFEHDEIAYNYRMPNINAALGVSQLEKLDSMLQVKRTLALTYKNFFDKLGIPILFDNKDTKSNYWLNAIILEDKKQRDEFLTFMNNNKVFIRPIWKLMPSLNMYKDCFCDNIENSQYLVDRVVNLPSSANCRIN